jgi:signal transduction histidine kinase
MKLATIYIYHNPDSTVNIAKRGLQVLKGNKSKWVPDIEIQLRSFLGHAYRLKGDFNAAIIAFQEMLDRTTSWQDSSLMVVSYFNIAYVYAEQEKYDSAVIFDLRALKIQELTHSLDIGKSYNSLGLDYSKIKRFDLALTYYKKAITFKKNNKQDKSLGNTYFNLGTVYKDLSKNDSALYFYELALDKAKELKDSIFIMEALQSIGVTHSKKGNYPLAKNYLLQSVALFKYLKLPYKIEIIPSYQELAKVYITLSNFEQAEDLLTRSKQILIENKATFSTKMKQNLALWELLSWSKKDFASARIYSQEHATLVDTLHQRDLDQKVYKILLDYEDKIKEQRIKALEQQQQISNLEYEKVSRERYLLIFAVLIMLLIVVVLYRLNKWRSKVNLELKTLNNTKDKLFSIIAHDLKNPLSAFRSITQSLSDDIFDISREDLDYFMKQLNHSAHNLFDLLQNLLYWSISQSGRLEFESQKITLTNTTEEVFNLLKGSAHLKGIALNNNIPIEITAWADHKMTHTILRNLVANAIKFTPNNGNITVNVVVSDLAATISVTDTGKGMTPEVVEGLFSLSSDKNKRNETEGKGTGLGLILCKELVEQQGGKIRLDSTSSQGSVFSFTLPIHPKKA